MTADTSETNQNRSKQKRPCRNQRSYILTITSICQPLWEVQMLSLWERMETEKKKGVGQEEEQKN